MPLPTFLIVGAAKAGTSSLVASLRAHPDAVVSRPSEPKFLTSGVLTFPHRGPGDDRIDATVVRSLAAYRALFADAGGAHAIGEKSPDLLYYHERAIPVIHEVIGRPKIVVTLRDPADRTFSAYNFMVGMGRETLSFEDALEAEAERLAANWEFIWAYQGASFYADAVAAYQAAFPEVHVVLLDDLKREPERTTAEVYAFLGLDPVGASPPDRVHNAHRAPRSQRVAAWRSGRGAVGAVMDLGRRVVPTGVLARVRSAVDGWSARPPELSRRQRDRLAATFAPDVRRLEGLIGRDLAAWRPSS